jgi:two-component system, LytTR family, sensor kinase
MKTFKLIRAYEMLLILVSATTFLIMHLTHNARRFDGMIEEAQQQGVPLSRILRDLKGYNNVPDFNIPLIAAAIFIIGSWAVLHYLAVPDLKDNERKQYGFGVLGLSLALMMVGVFVAKAFVRDFDYWYGINGIIGFRVFSKFRFLHVATSVITIAALFWIYEIIASLCYDLFSREHGRQLLLRKYLALAGILSVCISAIFTHAIPVIFDSLGLQQFLSIFLAVLLSLELRKFFTQYVINASPHDPVSVSVRNLVIYCALCVAASVVVWGLFSHFGQRVSPGIFYAFTFVFMILAPILLAYLSKKEKEVLETAVSSKSAEIENLRSQINPHFLFNALNSLYATALAEHSERTADGIQKLGDMMRFMLSENNRDRISLVSEIEYLQNYIDLQRMRLDETRDIEIRINIHQPGKDIYIAPMLLIPFIENAFKHGISMQSPSWIYVTLTFDTDRIYYKVHNSLNPLTSNDPERNNHGIGLDNVKKRLRLIYPGRHTLDIQSSTADFFVSLVISY